MYAVKVLHGYITHSGKRTRDKSQAKLYVCERTAWRLADKIGGRVQKVG